MWKLLFKQADQSDKSQISKSSQMLMFWNFQGTNCQSKEKSHLWLMGKWIIIFFEIWKEQSRGKIHKLVSSSTSNGCHQLILTLLMNLSYNLPSRTDASSCRTFQAAVTCLSSVNGAPTAKRSMYLPERTCK